MPVFTDALLGDTMHLSAEEFGAYCLLLFATWRNNGVPLPDDDRRLARICRVGERKWSSLRGVLAQFFNLTEGTWRQKRLEKEWTHCENLRAVNARKGALGGRPKSLNNRDTDKAAGLPGAKPDESPQTQTQTQVEKEEPSGSSKKPASDKRGTRLPSNFTLPAEWLAHGAEARSRHGLPPGELGAEAEKFVNYFASAPGAKGVKLDWHKTWINWALTAKGSGNDRGSGYQRYTVPAGELVVHVPKSETPRSPPPRLSPERLRELGFPQESQ